MADRVLLRSGASIAPPGFMRAGELAYSPSNYRLWLGDGTGGAQPVFDATTPGGLGNLTAISFGLDFSQGAVVANGTIVLVRKALVAMVLNSLDYEVGSTGGSFVVTTQIGGVNVTGLSGIAVSSATSANAVASAANAVSVGQSIAFVLSSVTGSPSGANLQLNATR